MAFNITEFRSSFGNFEPASPSTYEVSILRPPIINANGFLDGVIITDNTEDNLRFRCMACSLPGKILNATERYTYGTPRKIVTNAVYTDVMMTFIISDDMKEKNYFSVWHNLIIDNREFGDIQSHDAEYYENYVGDVSITHYAKNGDTKYIVNLIEAYPIAIEEIPLGWEQNNEFTRMNVTMAYRTWQATKLSNPNIEE